jgi:phosphatidate cytidylyltransferase
MLTRIITALIAIPIVVALVFYRGGLPFTILIGVVAVLGLLEFYGGARKGGARPHLLLGLAAGVLFIYFGRGYCQKLDIWGEQLPSLFYMFYLIPTFTGLVLLSLIFELIREERAPFVNVGVTSLGLGYVVWLLLHFIWLRSAEGTIRVGPWVSERGAWLVMFVLLATWAVDTGAYFIGKLYGSKKLAPRLSPGKTVEGSIAGFVSAVIIGAVTAAVIRMPQPHGLILGALIGIVGQIGDLAESALKREVGIKDFGSIVPGHGGILDRIDSLLFTGPVVFWYVAIFLSRWISP